MIKILYIGKQEPAIQPLAATKSSRHVSLCDPVVGIDDMLDKKRLSDRDRTNDTCNEPAELKPKRELHTTAEAFRIPCAV
jgi:hypothetical protein